MCAVQSRALLNASMCAQQTSAGRKGLCKVPVCTALSYYPPPPSPDTVFLFVGASKKSFCLSRLTIPLIFRAKALETFRGSASTQWSGWKMNDAVWPCVSTWSLGRLCFILSGEGSVSAKTLSQRLDWKKKKRTGRSLSFAGCCKRWSAVIHKVVTWRRVARF